LSWAFGQGAGTRVIVNVGGIANLCLLAPGRDVIGFDTGTGNTLLDRWTRRCLDLPYDDGGRWSAGGRPDPDLLAACLSDPWFSLPPPKSTGRETFNEDWLDRRISEAGKVIDDVNVAATLIELTAATIVAAIDALDPGDYELIVYGGGARNATLMARLGTLAGRTPRTMADFGIDPDYVEAAAMAWLARCRVEHEQGNLPTVTAARQGAILGALYCGDP
ncbi:MAG: anhydro-N-acetylmuramic acid kinase, partial [Gammaproteobacteria bacterium]|nr:anhydro-N-acetylmuramic acid kinase [Gammaproteobacteria bacterium]